MLRETSIITLYLLRKPRERGVHTVQMFPSTYFIIFF